MFFKREKIKDILVKTLISVETLMIDSINRMPEHKNNCFELFGFDIMIDENIKPWLLEVNVSPSLNTSSYLDIKLKFGLISDILNILGINPYNKKKIKLCFENNFMKDFKKKKNYNISNFDDLNYENCIEKLGIDDFNMLFELDEELYRKGNFERIFPVNENFEKYLKYFVYPKRCNSIINQWMKAEKNFLEKFCQKYSNLSI